MKRSHSKHKNHFPQAVFANTFARLHMGFLDLNGSLGRRFGSLGIGLDAPDTLIELVAGQSGSDLGAEPNYVARYKQRLLQHVREKYPDMMLPDVGVKVHREIPRHFGLGSGTQMALAIGQGLNQLLDIALSPNEVAAVTSRGQRSGIGIGTFKTGGFVIDDGRRAETVVPDIIAQYAFPEAWRILLIFDHQHVGMHGDEERAAFAALPDADLQATRNIEELVSAKALPAIQSQDLQAFGEVISALQAYTGDYFAPAQGGRYASKLVAGVLNDLVEHGVHCVGQSSWGPTGFAVFESQIAAEQQLARLQKELSEEGLTYQLCAARNVGASVKVALAE